MKEEETKLPSYWLVPHTEALLGMRAYSTTKWLQVPLIGGSARADRPGKPVPTKVGRDGWLSLIGNASLQIYCNQEGINVGTATARVRIGIVGNNENDCKSPDSRLGFGGKGKRVCGQKDDISCGNTAKCGGHKGDRATKAFGWVFVR